MGKFIFDDLTGDPTILATERAKRRDQTGATGSVHDDKNVVIPERAERVSGIQAKGDWIPHQVRDDRAERGTQTEVRDDNSEVRDDRTGVQGDKSQACFFCKGNEHLTPPTLYADEDNWNVRVVSNKYPLVADHDVVIHSPHHDKDLEDLDHEQVVRYIRALLNRVSFYGSQEKEVFIFNNRGSRAGASLTHPHSQIIALKGFPGNIQKEKEWSIRYFDEKNTCFWCDEVLEVIKEGSRVVLETKHFVAFVPKACKWSYEIRVSPKNHKPNFGFIDEQEINDFAGILQKVIQAYGKAFNAPDRNFWIHTNRYDPFHWHVGFLPHIKVFGAVELGAGIWVSDKATPEDAAKVLRENV